MPEIEHAPPVPTPARPAQDARARDALAGDPGWVPTPPVSVREVWSAWWPLAASWLLMGFELPAVSAVMARLPDPTVSLAAYGGVVFPLALLIESPIIMLLSASTALSKDRASYRLVRRFMLVAGLSLTAFHALVAFTPLYDFVVGQLLRPPPDVLEPGRIGMMIMTPWTIAIAYRRFQQGLLIRFGRSHAVGVGTGIRLGTNVLVLALGWAIGAWPGIVVGTVAVASSVVAEAIFAGIVAHGVIRGPLATAPPLETPLTMKRFLRFYTPLLVTPFLLFFAMPLASAAMSRMPRALDSLAAWPVVNGLVFTLRSVAFGLNEVAVSVVERPRSLAALTRFTGLLAVALTAVLLALVATPLSGVWLGTVSALPAELVPLAATGLALAFLLPALTAYQSLYQGVVVYSHRTSAVTESMVVFLLVCALVLGIGIQAQGPPGLHVALVAFVLGTLAQVVWLAWRAQPELNALAARDRAAQEAPVPGR
ncbi:MAG: hypothetical protein ACREOU_16975 [Candidatus Eiseniibacteriota bacterium]